MYISYFRRHLNKHKCPLVTSDANCDICERDPETFYKLKNHIQVNQSRKIIPCQDCGKKFKTVQELKTHSVVHSGNKPYVNLKLAFPNLPRNDKTFGNFSFNIRTVIFVANAQFR